MDENELPDAWRRDRLAVAPLPVLAGRYRPPAVGLDLDEADLRPFAASPEPRPDAQTKQGR